MGRQITITKEGSEGCQRSVEDAPEGFFGVEHAASEVST